MGWAHWQELVAISQETLAKLNERWIAMRQGDAQQLAYLHWDAIEHVASALLERRELTGEELTHIMGHEPTGRAAPRVRRALSQRA
jgi:hypothetical protein